MALPEWGDTLPPLMGFDQEGYIAGHTHRVVCDEPIALQAFIHEVTRGGNENMELLK